MANTVEVTKLLSGSRLSIFHVYIASDGADGDLTDEVLIDPVVDLGLKTDARMGIEKITHSFSGFTARVEFDTGLVADKMIWVLPATSNSDVDFRSWGALKDRSGLDGTGKLQITTTGLTAVGDEGSILIQVRS